MLRRLFGKTRARDYAVELHDCSSGSFDLEVVGESRYQDTIRAARRASPGPEPYPEMIVVLIREPSNRYDTNAIQVHASGIGTVGYIGRDDAEDLAAHLDALGGKVACRGKIIGGPENDRPSYGVVLDLDVASLASRGRGK